MIAHARKYIQQYLACRRLNRLVKARLNSYEHRRFVERREASKKGWATLRATRSHPTDQAALRLGGSRFDRAQ
jgi:hypothetical protein